jgi:hypothetical protein
MSRFRSNITPCGRTRRQFLWQIGGGFAGLALADLLAREPSAGLPAEAAPPPLAPRPAPFRPRAKHAIFLFMNGGPSQVDTFDPKPALRKFHGTPYAGSLKVGSNGRPIGHLMASPFPFQRHGRSGLEISSLFPNVARFADDLCVIRSMRADTAAHASGCLQMNSGSIFIGHPSLGAWINYGLGSPNENLPAFVVMTDPRGGPIGGASNWSSGYMPAAYQGTLFRSTGSPLLDLATPAGVDASAQRATLDLLGDLNHRHLQEHAHLSGAADELSARMATYELAWRMQTAAADVADVAQESAATRQMYGIDNPRTSDFARKCLVARRLVERGVRFVQIYSGGGHLEETWDGHADCVANHTLHAGETDQPIAALLADLQRTGLWEETLVIWGGEFGRTPTSEGVGKSGRDHNWHGFTMWLAGAGIRGGQAVGATDELGFAAVDEPVHVSDLHATILHLMGLDHQRLTFFHAGLDRRLTGVTEERRVVEKVLS